MKTRRHWRMMWGVMMSLMTLAACAAPPPPPPSATPAPPTATVPTNTPYVRPTLPPTFTPTFTPSATFTPTITLTPSITPSPTLIPEDALCADFYGRFAFPDGHTYDSDDTLLLDKFAGNAPVGVLFELVGAGLDEPQRVTFTSTAQTIPFGIRSLSSGRYDWTLSLFDDERAGLCAITGYFLVDAGDAPTAEADSAAPLPTRALKQLDATRVPTITKSALEVQRRWPTAAPSPTPTAAVITPAPEDD